MRRASAGAAALNENLMDWRAAFIVHLSRVIHSRAPCIPNFLC